MIGGTETYGKFVADPFPALVEVRTGLRTINLGCVNAGPDAFLNEPVVFDIAAHAQVTVLQVMGAQNLTNRFYAVHPRRNDRFLRADPRLRAMFPDVDFTEFHFTRHMLRALRAAGPERFEIVADELRSAWVQRMSRLARRLGDRVILLWLADRSPGQSAKATDALSDPILVDAEMVAAVRIHVADYVEVVSSPAARSAGVAGMCFAPLDRLAAAEVPGPAVHRDAAAALAPHLLRLV